MSSKANTEVNLYANFELVAKSTILDDMIAQMLKECFPGKATRVLSNAIETSWQGIRNDGNNPCRSGPDSETQLFIVKGRHQRRGSIKGWLARA